MASLEHGILKDFHTKQFSSREIPQKKKRIIFSTGGLNPLL